MSEAVNLDDAQLDDLEAKAQELIQVSDAAPDGPWYRGDAFRAADAHWVAVNSDGSRKMVTSSCGNDDRAVIDFVVAARNDGRALVAAILALSAELRRLRALTTPSPTETIRLTMDDGSVRDAPRNTRCAHVGESLDDSVLEVRHHRGSYVTTEWGRAWVEPLSDLAERERAARLETERQRDEARGELAGALQELHAVHDVLSKTGVKYGVYDPVIGPDFSTAKRVEVALDNVARGASHAMPAPEHLYEGDCPYGDDTTARDPDCPACHAMGPAKKAERSTAPVSTTLRERLGRLVYEAWCDATMSSPGARAIAMPFEERRDDLRDIDYRIGEAVQSDAEARIAESLRQRGKQLVRSSDPEDQAAGAARLCVAREVERGEHRGTKAC